MSAALACITMNVQQDVMQAIRATLWRGASIPEPSTGKENSHLKDGCAAKHKIAMLAVTAACCLPQEENRCSGRNFTRSAIAMSTAIDALHIGSRVGVLLAVVKEIFPSFTVFVELPVVGLAA